jgi:hypothetical protein
VDPPPGTHAFAVGARGHIGGYVKDSVTVPDTIVLDRKDGHILWADIFGYVGVGDGKRTPCDVGVATGMEIFVDKLMIYFDV